MLDFNKLHRTAEQYWISIINLAIKRAVLESYVMSQAQLLFSRIQTSVNLLIRIDKLFFNFIRNKKNHKKTDVYSVQYCAQQNAAGCIICLYDFVSSKPTIHNRCLGKAWVRLDKLISLMSVNCFVLWRNVSQTLRCLLLLVTVKIQFHFHFVRW